MKIEQIYTGCLAHAAYYLQDSGEAAIFDPLRPNAKPQNVSSKWRTKIHKSTFDIQFLFYNSLRATPAY
ncbi:MAG: Metallo-beta-lactamase family protein [Bacteroidetes bacterium]|nr:Metallo-beta-lactamase family protein [Bacteroidota bacterium]